jgi:WD40 repeat protein
MAAPQLSAAAASSSAPSADDLDWKFVQSFGDDNSSDGQLHHSSAMQAVGREVQVTMRGGALRASANVVASGSDLCVVAHTSPRLLFFSHSPLDSLVSPLLLLLCCFPLPICLSLFSDDLVTAVEFDETGQYLAVGDKAGRICIFEGHTVTASPNSLARPIIPLEYKFYTEFQSHEPEFDCLKSLEIEEKINMIKWGKKINNGLFLLACNGQSEKRPMGLRCGCTSIDCADTFTLSCFSYHSSASPDKTIKYWKVHEKKIKRPIRLEAAAAAAALSASHPTFLSVDVPIPKLAHHQTITTATPKRIYSNAHGYHINSISINSDGETFISADDLRINL